MDKTCDITKLEERQHPRDWLPLFECKQCIFSVLCNDYLIHEESNSDEEHIEAMKDCGN